MRVEVSAIGAKNLAMGKIQKRMATKSTVCFQLPVKLRNWFLKEILIESTPNTLG
jgi:hypothetical protein